MKKNTDLWKVFVSLFCFFSAFLLFVTAAAKILSAVGNQGVLNTLDPVFGIRTRSLLWAVALVETGIAVLLLRSRMKWFSCLLVSMLGGQFILYRKIFAWGHYSRGCPCLGTIGQRLPVSQEHLNGALFAIALWFLVGGIIAALISYRKAEWC